MSASVLCCFDWSLGGRGCYDHVVPLMSANAHRGFGVFAHPAPGVSNEHGVAHLCAAMAMILQAPLLFLVVITGAWPVLPAMAQRADVVRPAANGNFLTTKVQGNRGEYHQMLWLVIDQDRNGLNCRSLGGDAVPLVSLDYGSILRTAIAQSQLNGIVFQDDQAWLPVDVGPRGTFVFDHRPLQARGEMLRCKVRANAALITPINPDAFDETAAPGVRTIPSRP